MDDNGRNRLLRKTLLVLLLIGVTVMLFGCGKPKYKLNFRLYEGDDPGTVCLDVTYRYGGPPYTYTGICRAL